MHLEKIVLNPFIYYSNNETALTYLDKYTSDKELQKLLKAEHSILRALAFKYLSIRKSVNITKILLDNLDDTATISNYEGVLENTVADFMLDESRGKTNILKAALIDTVITKHPYLIHSASFFIRVLDTDEKYYPYLKKIVQNKYPWHYRIEEELIVKLSGYKKNEDTSEIAKSIEYKWFKKEADKFLLIENNPVGAYFFAIEKYYKRLLAWYDQKYLQDEFIRDEGFSQTFEKFIFATAAYKSKKSADILMDILNRKIYHQNSIEDKTNYGDICFQYILSNAIKKHQSFFYKNLLVMTKEATNIYEKKYAIGPMEAYIDTIKEKNTW